MTHSATDTVVVSRSRNVNAYVKRAVRLARMQRRARAAYARYAPLREVCQRYASEVNVARLKLTGGQMAEAERLLAQRIKDEVLS